MQVSGESVDEYKQQVREGLRRLLDPPGDAIGGPAESIVVYVKPSSVDAFSKGPGKVYSELCDSHIFFIAPWFGLKQ